MPRPRVQLQTELETFLGSRSVYFQPPETVKLSFPCILYERSRNDDYFADNSPYIRRKAYKVTIIDKDVDTTLPDRFMDTIQYCRWDRVYVADNLYHYVFTLFY